MRGHLRPDPGPARPLDPLPPLEPANPGPPPPRPALRDSHVEKGRSSALGADAAGRLGISNEHREGTGPSGSTTGSSLDAEGQWKYGHPAIDGRGTTAQSSKGYLITWQHRERSRKQWRDGIRVLKPSRVLTSLLKSCAVHMTPGSAPAIAQVVPEVHIRALVDRYGFRELVGTLAQRQRFFRVVRLIEEAMKPQFDGEVPPCLLRDGVAPVIIHGSAFLEYVKDRAGEEALQDPERLRRLAQAAAGAIVAEYLWEGTG